MRAVVFSQYGGPEVLRLQDVPAPTPGPGEVLVRVHAVSVNRTHCLAVRRGTYAQVRFPHVLGVDPSGVVAAAGSAATSPAVGVHVAVHHAIPCGSCEYCRMRDEESCTRQQHIGVHRWGGYAEYVSVPATNAHVVPERLSFAEATLIVRHFPLAFGLARKAGLAAGEWALVMGAAGGLGGSIVQVAKLLGARVIAGAGSEERVDLARSYGADAGVNYRRDDLARTVLRLTADHGADVVFDNIADPDLWPGAFGSLAYRGRLVTAGAHGGGAVTLDVSRLYRRQLRIIGSPRSSAADIERAIAAAAAGSIRAVRIDRVLPLREAATAHRLVEENRVMGKIVLDPQLA